MRRHSSQSGCRLQYFPSLVTKKLLHASCATRLEHDSNSNTKSVTYVMHRRLKAIWTRSNWRCHIWSKCKNYRGLCSSKFVKLLAQVVSEIFRHRRYLSHQRSTKIYYKDQQTEISTIHAQTCENI